MPDCVCRGNASCVFLFLFRFERLSPTCRALETRTSAALRVQEHDLVMRQRNGVWRLSEQWLDPQRPRAFTQALMDLSPIDCRPCHPCFGFCSWLGYRAA